MFQFNDSANKRMHLLKHEKNIKHKKHTTDFNDFILQLLVNIEEPPYIFLNFVKKKCH